MRSLILSLSLALFGMLLFLPACSQPSEKEPEIRYKTKTEIRYVPVEGVIRVDPSKKDPKLGIYGDLQSAIDKSDGRIIQVVGGTYHKALKIPKGKTIIIYGDAKNPFLLETKNKKPSILVEESATLFLKHAVIKSSDRGIQVEKSSTLDLSFVLFKSCVGQAISATSSILTLRNLHFQKIVKAAAADFKRLGNPQAIRTFGGELTLQKSKFEDVGDRGVLLTNEAVGTITTSQFKRESGEVSVVAIAFQKGSSGLVHDCQVDGWKEGLYLSNAHVQAFKLTLTNLRGSGILVGTKGRLYLESSTISKAKASCISFSGGSGIIRKSILEDCGDYGIFIDQKTALGESIIDSNTLRRITATGIQIFKSQATVQNNKISEVKKGGSATDGHGIGALDSSGIRLINNTIDNVEGSGVYFLRATGLISQNKISAAKEGGVLINYTSEESKPQIYANIIKKCKVAGIFLLSAIAELKNNEVIETIFSKKEQSGTGVVLFQNSKAYIDGDRYEKSEQHGMFLIGGAQAEVKNTTFAKNKLYGIYRQCGASKLTEEKNSYKGNVQGDKNTCP